MTELPTTHWEERMMPDKPRYRIHYDDIPVINITPEDPGNVASFVVRMVYGTDTSIMFADRGPGYHTKPHYHDAEQVNIVSSGEMWFFVEQHGYRCRKGDIMRIPRNKIHWAWNRSPEPLHSDRIAYAPFNGRRGPPRQGCPLAWPGRGSESHQICQQHTRPV